MNTIAVIFFLFEVESFFLVIMLEFSFPFCFQIFPSYVQNVASEKPVEEVKVISDIVKDSRHKVICSLQKINGLQFCSFNVDFVSTSKRPKNLGTVILTSLT